MYNIYHMKKTTYNTAYFLFLLGFIIVTVNLTIIQRQDIRQKYNIKPFWKINPIQTIKQVLANPLPLVLILMIFFAIEKILIHLGIRRECVIWWDFCQ